MNNYNRGRYTPGIGAGRGAGMNANPSFQSRVPQQQYVQRNSMQNHQQFQQQQQQQWLRRTQLPPADSSVDEVEKTVQSEAVDSRSAYPLTQIYYVSHFKYSSLYSWVSFYALRVSLNLYLVGVFWCVADIFLNCLSGMNLNACLSLCIFFVSGNVWWSSNCAVGVICAGNWKELMVVEFYGAIQHWEM